LFCRCYIDAFFSHSQLGLTAKILKNCTIIDLHEKKFTLVVKTHLSTCQDWLNIVGNTSYEQIFSSVKPVTDYKDMYYSLSQCDGKVLINGRQEMDRDIKSMLPALEPKSRRRYKYYHVNDSLVPNGHSVVANTHGGRRVFDTFTRFVESGMLNEWEKVKK